MPRITSVKQRQLVAASPDNTKEQFLSRRIFDIGTGFSGLIERITLQTDGKFLVGGDITLFNGESIGSRFTRLNADGTLDTAFNANLGTGFGNKVRAISVQSDGKILVGGDFTTFNGNTRNRLVRLNSDGTEDTAFYANLGTAFNNSVYPTALQPDGGIIVVGLFTTFNGNTRNRLVRLNADGTEDTAFYANLGTGFGGSARAISVQSDGKIVVGGFFTTLNEVTRNRLVRLNSDGTEDTGFYSNLGTSFNDIVDSTVLQPDGKILVVGQFISFNGTTRKYLVRLNSDGTEDTEFNNNLGDGFSTPVRAVSVQSDGKILVGGVFTVLSNVPFGVIRNRLVRLNADGTEDTAFYTNLGTAFNNTVNSIALQSDGKILVGGQFTQLNGATYGSFVRLDSRGIADIASIPAATYAVGALDIINLFNTSTNTGFNSTVSAVALQPDDKILVGGFFTTFNGNSRRRLMRLNSDGTEDTVFNNNLGTGFSSALATANIETIALQSDGKILVGGQFDSFNGVTRRYLVRLNSDGTEDTAFYTNLGTSFNSTVRAIALQSDGKILVGGSFTSLDGVTLRYLVRLNSDGTEDTAFYTNLGTSFNGAVYAIALQSDGKILVGGSFTSLDGVTRNRLVRLNSDGTEDTAFYTNLGTAFNSTLLAIALQPDDKILVGGFFTSLNGPEPGTTRGFLVRLNSDGTEDTAFYTNLGTAFNGLVYATALQSDGKIVVGGSFGSFNGNTRSRLVRLNSDGTEDTAFYTNLGTGFNGTTYVTLQSDGKILVYGVFTELNGATRRVLARLNADGAVITESDNIDEGSNLAFTVTTANVSDGTVMRWRILDRPEDFAVGTGLTTINSNTATFAVTPTADLLTEGPETFRVEVSKLTGTVLATSSSVTINDTSTST